jgi:hypothetical protein
MDNRGVLESIESIMGAFRDLIAINVINATTIEDFANTFRTEWEKLITASGDLESALLMMGPNIGQLYEAFKRLGVDVPEWLATLYDEAVKAGASLEPPESVEDILGQIRDVLHSIAVELGAIASATAVIDIPVPIDPMSRADIPPWRGGGALPMAQGFQGVFDTPTPALFGEAGPEFVQAVPLRDITPGSSPGGGDSPVVNINFHGPVFGNEEDFKQVVRETVNEGLRYNYQDLRTETRLAVE